MELADEAELVSLAVGLWAVDRWKKMILLVHIVKQEADTEKRESGGERVSRGVMHLSLIVRRNYAPPHV